MSTRHHWFRSGEYSLSGNIDLPESARSQSGVLIVPPFGWEDVCSYRPLRSLGLLFASQGIPAMRFDLPGTGDSSGDALDLELLEAWIRSIGDAAEKLREVSGVRDVAVVGVRMGAVLALAAATRGANVQDLILWGPSASGRSVVRELRAFSKMARAEYSNGAPPPPQPITGLEAGGFLLAPETQRALEAVDFSALPEMRGRRVLMLSRDELPADAKLVTALRSAGCAVEVQTGNGYAAMMAIPEEALAPAAAGHAIIDFLKGRSKDGEHRMAERTVSANKRVAEMATPVKTSHGNIVERVYRVDRPSGSLFGILSNQRHQIANPEWCVLFLNAGAVRHTGPNRMWVEAARRLAVRGITSLRLDLEGIGESEGEASLDVASLYQDRLVEQVESAMKSLRMNLGVQKFALAGLCSGAFWAFHAALRNPEVRTAILLNPRLFFWDPEIDRRRVLRRTARLLTESTDWGRLMRGYVSVDSLKRVSRVVVDRFRTNRAGGKRCQIPPEGMAEARRALERNQNRLTIIFTEGEPLLREMEDEGHLSGEMSSRIRCIRLANCGHTFRPLWAQSSVHELIDRELDAVLNTGTETAVYRDMAHQNAEQSGGSPG